MTKDTIIIILILALGVTFYFMLTNKSEYDRKLKQDKEIYEHELDSINTEWDKSRAELAIILPRLDSIRLANAAIVTLDSLITLKLDSLEKAVVPITGSQLEKLMIKTYNENR
jgi:hypothetical protein